MNLMILVARGEIFRLFTNELWGIIKSLGYIQLPLAENLSICLTALSKAHLQTSWNIMHFISFTCP